MHRYQQQSGEKDREHLVGHCHVAHSAFVHLLPADRTFNGTIGKILTANFREAMRAAIVQVAYCHLSLLDRADRLADEQGASDPNRIRQPVV